MKTYELTGVALDWAVAKCEGLLALGWEDDMGLLKITFSTGEAEYYAPSIKWEQGPTLQEALDLVNKRFPDINFKGHLTKEQVDALGIKI